MNRLKEQLLETSAMQAAVAIKTINRHGREVESIQLWRTKEHFAGIIKSCLRHSHQRWMIRNEGEEPAPLYITEFVAANPDPDQVTPDEWADLVLADNHKVTFGGGAAPLTEVWRVL